MLAGLGDGVDVGAAGNVGGAGGGARSSGWVSYKQSVETWIEIVDGVGLYLQ